MNAPLDFRGQDLDAEIRRLKRERNAVLLAHYYQEGEIQELAEGRDIPHQVIFCGGGTDARSFQPAGARAMALGIPLRYTHSMVELAHADDVEATVLLVEALVGRYAT